MSKEISKVNKTTGLPSLQFQCDSTRGHDTGESVGNLIGLAIDTKKVIPSKIQRVFYNTSENHLGTLTSIGALAFSLDEKLIAFLP